MREEKKKVITVIVIALLIASMNYGCFHYLSRRYSRTKIGLVVTEDLKAGAQITPSMLQEVEVPYNLNERYFESDRTSLEGLYVRKGINIMKGDLITSSDLTSVRKEISSGLMYLIEVNENCLLYDWELSELKVNLHFKSSNKGEDFVSGLFLENVRVHEVLNDEFIDATNYDYQYLVLEITERELNLIETAKYLGEIEIYNYSRDGIYRYYDIEKMQDYLLSRSKSFTVLIPSIEVHEDE